MSLTEEEATDYLELKSLVNKNLHDAVTVSSVLAADWPTLSFDSDRSEVMNEFIKIYYSNLTYLSEWLTDIVSAYEAICDFNECDYK